MRCGGGGGAAPSPRLTQSRTGLLVPRTDAWPEARAGRSRNPGDRHGPALRRGRGHRAADSPGPSHSGNGRGLASRPSKTGWTSRKPLHTRQLHLPAHAGCNWAMPESQAQKGGRTRGTRWGCSSLFNPPQERAEEDTLVWPLVLSPPTEGPRITHCCVRPSLDHADGSCTPLGPRTCHIKLNSC